MKEGVKEGVSRPALTRARDADIPRNRKARLTGFQRCGGEGTTGAAGHTIVGYGVNDTIVLFDRVREELKRDQKTDFKALTNRCVNLTLSRTILTSATTLFTVLSLLIFTSGDIKGFAVLRK